MAEALVLVDSEGTTQAFLEPDELTVTRQWCGGSSVTARLDVRDPKTELILPAATALQLWLDEELRFHGPVGEPLSSDEQNVNLVAHDPWDTLGARKLTADETYTAEDAGAVAWASIATEDARSPLGIREGTIQATTNRTVTFNAGTTRADLITQLSQMDGGFSFALDPVANVPGIYAEFNVWGIENTTGGVTGDGSGPKVTGKYRPPSSGGSTNRGELLGVRFEYGDGTLDNCDGFTEELSRPRNRVIAQGQALADGTRPQVVAEDTTSQGTYGLWEYVVSVDTTSTAVLGARALAELRPDPVATYTMKPTPDAPLMFRDFLEGNVVQLTIKHGRVDVTGSARVDACTIKRDTSDWRIDSLTLSSPVVHKIARGANDRLYGLMGSYADRLALLERARVVGS